MGGRLQGKTALVTGSTSNIGRAIATAFAAEGAHVVVSGRNGERGSAVVGEIRAANGRADFVEADLDGTTAASDRLAEEASRVLGGRIDILVNNAGIFPGSTTTDTDEETFDRVYAVNVKAAPTFLTCRRRPGHGAGGRRGHHQPRLLGRPPRRPGRHGLYSSTKGAPPGSPRPALDGLTALAAPQPLGTLLQPLRLTGAVAAVPVTGVLCTGNGPGIEMVQLMVEMGESALQPLADPRVTFFELPTGHWPMLSCPHELADVLTESAAGGGHRLKPADADHRPGHLRPFLLDLPERPRERTGNTDLYLPGGTGPHPAVVFVHGGPVPAGARPTPRDWPTLKGYARYVAGRGAVGVTVDHRLHAVTDYERAAEDVTAAVERVRADPRVDGDRIALWFFSGGGPLTADWLAAPPAWLRCLAADYPIMAPLPSWGMTGARFHPVRAVARAGGLPIVLVRAGREMAEIAATVEEFLTEAERCGANVEVVDVPDGRHGFETLDPTDDSRAAVHRAVGAVLAHLTA
ncbi:hypothetical protein SMICM304S_09565 [Streptomyces microflavus]